MKVIPIITRKLLCVNTCRYTKFCSSHDFKYVKKVVRNLPETAVRTCISYDFPNSSFFRIKIKLDCIPLNFIGFTTMILFLSVQSVENNWKQWNNMKSWPEMDWIELAKYYVFFFQMALWLRRTSTEGVVETNLHDQRQF